MDDKTSPAHDPVWDTAWGWIQKQHEVGFADPVFNADLNQWLDQDPSHRHAYDKAARIWAVAGLLPPAHDIAATRRSDAADD
ncbi:MAG: DUF4880 domain-containing protein [Burkholderiaceae bacterium]